MFPNKSSNNVVKYFDRNDMWTVQLKSTKITKITLKSVNHPYSLLLLQGEPRSTF